MTTRKKKPGRPPRTSPKPKASVVYLDQDRQRQLAQIVKRNGGSHSAAIGQAISFHHAHLKREWPDDFS